MTVNPEMCPKFSHCSAPVCPLDPKWHRTRHLRDEPTCLYLREVSKASGEATVRGVLPGELVEPILAAYQDIITQQRTPLEQGFGELRRVLQRSARTGSKLAHGNRLRTAEKNQKKL